MIKTLKKNLYLLLIVKFSIILFINCSDKISEPQVDEKIDYKSELHKLLSLEIGNEFNYNIDSLNKQTNSYEKIGERLMTVMSNTTDNDEDFVECTQDYSFSDSTANKKTRILFTNNSIQYFVDTSGISSFLSDSINFDISVSLDETAKLVEYPYAGGQSWNVFNAFAYFGGAKFNVFSISGKYIGSEQINFSNSSQLVNTEKFQYNGELNVPNIDNPFVSNLHSYIAYAWISPDYGIVKLEGFSLFISPLTGDHFNISDSSKVFRHTLVN